MDEMLAFESMGQGMMGEQLHNEQGAIIPAWMINGQLCYPFTDTYEPSSAEMIPAIAERTDLRPLEVPSAADSCRHMLPPTGSRTTCTITSRA